MSTISGSNLSSSLIQQLQQQRQALFQNADTDSSGGLSLEEFKAVGPTDSNGNVIVPPEGAPSVEDIYASLDADGDGSLTQAEIEAGPPQGAAKPGSQSLLSSDTLGGLLSQLGDEELNAFFEFADTDADGNLTEAELQSAIETITSNSAPPPPSGSPPPAGGAGGSPPSEESEGSSSQVFDVLDTNQDGTVSLDEILAANDDSEDEENSLFSEILSLTKFTSSLLSAQEQSAA